MIPTPIKTSIPLHFTQIAWVVKDVQATLSYFRDVMGIHNFSELMTIRAKDFNATYHEKPSDGESLVAIAYSGGTFIELIQPTLGHSLFHDWLENNPAGGIQHVAYSLPIAGFDKAVLEITEQGFQQISFFDTPIAKIAFFDTYKEIGIATEIMGITEAGVEAVERMKGGNI